jgi:CheY-like chemotaxis protein
MPNFDGHDFLRVWSQDPTWRRVPVVVVSAASEEGHDVVTCDSIRIWRAGGFSVGDMVRVVRGGLASLVEPVNSTS